jgi:ferredoxin, 2Fe-2S
MLTLHLVSAEGTRRSLQVRSGQSLMRAATDAGVAEIAADCGGLMSCATCHVMVDAAWLPQLPPPCSDETSMLKMTAVPAQAHSRLSCQITLTAMLDGLVIHLPTHQY